jgi:pimeloyl-ACP methyl ester carboxylesterase
MQTAAQRKATLAIGALLLAACVTARPGLPADAGPPELQREPYLIKTRDGGEVAGELGRLRVPENRRARSSRWIELVFLRLPSTSPRPGPPLVYLAGGPGESGIETARGVGLDTFMALRGVADVIVIDQRGTGKSGPSLECAGSWGFPLDRPGNRSDMLRIARERVRACAGELRRRGIDLAGYTTAASADDVEAVRRALGAPKISLWGISYGAHLALATLRRHEGRIHRVVLTGVSGPDHAMLKLPSSVDRQIDAVQALFQADAGVRSRIPDLKGLIRDLLKQLERRPVTVTVSAAGGMSHSVTVGKWDLQFFLSNRLTTTWGLMDLPGFLEPMSRGEFTPLAREALAFRQMPVRSLMPLLMIGSSGASQERRDRVRREARSALLGDAINFLYPEIADALAPAAQGERLHAPVRARVPVLCISGTLDGRTPSSNAEEVCRSLPNSEQLVVTGASHGYDLFYFLPAVRGAMIAFLRGEPLPETRIRLAPFRFTPMRRDPDG